MTKKDYIIIARTIKRHYEDNAEHYFNADANIALGNLVKALCSEFCVDNRRFDANKFLSMCGFYK